VKNINVQINNASNNSQSLDVASITFLRHWWSWWITAATIERKCIHTHLF